MADEARKHLPLAPHDFEILVSLSRGPQHGYGMIRDIRERSGGDIVLGTSTLYATLRRLQRTGVVALDADTPEDSSGPPRRYWRITQLGQDVARLEVGRLRRAASAAEAMFNDGLARIED